MDYFAMLELPRRPWLEAEVVKASFQRMAATAHPDAGGGPGAFAELNAAWQALRDPVTRLRHFLELEHPAALALGRETPGELGDLFMDIADARQAAQGFTGRRQAAFSPLARALLEPERLGVQARLEALAVQVEARQGALQNILQQGETMDAELGRCLNGLTFLGKWEAELRELRHGLAA
jgi:curved DNA-binding protein CbpA